MVGTKMTSKKRTFDKQESAKSIALRELEEAKEAVKQAQEKVVQEITKEACHDFKQTMQTTHEARKKIDYAFTRLGLGNSAYFSHLFSFKWALGLVSK